MRVGGLYTSYTLDTLPPLVWGVCVCVVGSHTLYTLDTLPPLGVWAYTLYTLDTLPHWVFGPLHFIHHVHLASSG